MVGEDVPIASNTSALPISLLQAQRKHPSRFLGMHWAEPAYATRFLELIRGNHTYKAGGEFRNDTWTNRTTANRQGNWTLWLMFQKQAMFGHDHECHTNGQQQQYSEQTVPLIV